MYRRGIPANPRKCWGKKVILTPINISVNCESNHLLFMFNPIISGYQWVTPAMIAKTAPIDKT